MLIERSRCDEVGGFCNLKDFFFFFSCKFLLKFSLPIDSPHFPKRKMLAPPHKFEDSIPPKPLRNFSSLSDSILKITHCPTSLVSHPRTLTPSPPFPFPQSSPLVYANWRFLRPSALFTPLVSYFTDKGSPFFCKDPLWTQPFPLVFSHDFLSEVHVFSETIFLPTFF